MAQSWDLKWFETEGRQSIFWDEIKKNAVGLRTRKMCLKSRRIHFFLTDQPPKSVSNESLLPGTSNNYSSMTELLAQRADLISVLFAIHWFLDIPPKLA